MSWFMFRNITIYQKIWSQKINLWYKQLFTMLKFIGLRRLSENKYWTA